MRLSELRYVRVGEMDFPIKVTNRAMILYEQLTGNAVIKFTGSENLTKLFYATAQAGARAEGKPFPYDYEGFLDVIDDYHMEVVNGFGETIFELITGKKLSEIEEMMAEATEEEKKN
jgi:hypothetical protein